LFGWLFLAASSPMKLQANPYLAKAGEPIVPVASD